MVDNNLVVHFISAVGCNQRKPQLEPQLGIAAWHTHEIDCTHEILRCRKRSSDAFEGPDKFHAKAVQDIKRWNECVEKLGQFACLKRYDPQQLVKGMYAEFIEVRR